MSSAWLLRSSVACTHVAASASHDVESITTLAKVRGLRLHAIAAAVVSAAAVNTHARATASKSWCSRMLRAQRRRPGMPAGARRPAARAGRARRVRSEPHAAARRPQTRACPGLRRSAARGAGGPSARRLRRQPEITHTHLGVVHRRLRAATARRGGQVCLSAQRAARRTSLRPPHAPRAPGRGAGGSPTGRQRGGARAAPPGAFARRAGRRGFDRVPAPIC